MKLVLGIISGFVVGVVITAIVLNRTSSVATDIPKGKKGDTSGSDNKDQTTAQTQQQTQTAQQTKNKQTSQQSASGSGINLKTFAGNISKADQASYEKDAEEAFAEIKKAI